MVIRNTTHRWGAVAQLLHWLIVVLIIVQVTLAALAGDLPLGMKKLAMLARHKSVGLTILGLAIVRLGWRQLNPTPALPQTLKPYERTLARFTHAMLYVLLFAMPLSGWMTHQTLAVVLGAVVTLHVAAALKHHYVLRDDVLQRMLPLSTTTQGTRR